MDIGLRVWIRANIHVPNLSYRPETKAATQVCVTVSLQICVSLL